MGILKDLISAELTKKRDERIDKMNAYAAMLGMPDDKVSPEKKNQYLQLWIGDTPSSAKPLVQQMGSKLIGLGRKPKTGEAIGQMYKTPTTEGDKKSDNSIGADEMGAPRSSGQAKQAPSMGGKSGPGFNTPEEQEAIQKRENAMATARATAITEGQERARLMVDKARRVENQQDIEALAKRYRSGEIDDLVFQQEMMNITGRAPEEYATQPATMIYPNGQRMIGAASSKKPNQLLIVSPDGKSQQWITKPLMARIQLDRAPSEAEEKDSEIFGDYASRHGLDKDNLSDSDKIAARQEAKAKEPTDSGAELKERESALKNIHPEWSPEQVKKQASLDYLADMRAKQQQREVQINMNSGEKLSDEDLRELAGYAIKTGQDPKLAYRDPSSFTRYNKIKAELIKSKGGAGEAAAERASFGASSASLKKLQGFADFTNAFAGFTEGQMKRLNEQALKSGLTKTRLWNKPISAWKTQVTGDPQFAQYLFQLETTKAEVNRILTAPGSQGQVPEGMRKDLEKFLNDELSPEAIVGVTKQAALDIEGRRKSYDEQLSGITSRISGNGGGGTGGTIDFKSDDGKLIYHIPATEVREFIKDHPKAVRQ